MDIGICGYFRGRVGDSLMSYLLLVLEGKVWLKIPFTLAEAKIIKDNWDLVTWLCKLEKTNGN